MKWYILGLYEIPRKDEISNLSRSVAKSELETVIEKNFSYQETFRPKWNH